VAAAGGLTNLARLTDGSVLAWGINDVGQLGVGESTGPETCSAQSLACSTLPVGVHLPSGTSIAAIAATFEDGLALTSGGTALAWGDNFAGQLGIGSNQGPDSCGAGGFACSTTPVQVHVPSGVFVLGLAGGFQHVLAETSSHNLLAWGSNNSGELGIGTAQGPEMCTSGGLFIFCSTTPVFVLGPGGTSPLSNVIAMSAGTELTLAVTATTPPGPPGPAPPAPITNITVRVTG
jgi:alpha-tubulin suppressor-like RCC1 family protein